MQWVLPQSTYLVGIWSAICSHPVHPYTFFDSERYLFLEASLTHTICLTNLFIGSCVAQGFTGCCTSSCVVSAGGSTCYCDQLCFSFGDCCSDIEEAGCFPPGLPTTVSSTVTPFSIAIPTPGTYTFMPKIFFYFESYAVSAGGSSTCHCDQVCYKINPMQAY